MTSKLLVLVCAAVLIGAAPKADLSTPEKTIETYYIGYKTGNKALILATFLSKGDLSDLGLGIDHAHEIMEKKLVLSSKLSAKPGDMELVVYVTVRWPEGDRQMITTFVVRKVGHNWKIAGYDSYDSGTRPVD